MPRLLRGYPLLPIRVFLDATDDPVDGVRAAWKEFKSVMAFAIFDVLYSPDLKYTRVSMADYVNHMRYGTPQVCIPRKRYSDCRALLCIASPMATVCFSPAVFIHLRLRDKTTYGWNYRRMKVFSLFENESQLQVVVACRPRLNSPYLLRSFALWTDAMCKC